MRYQSIGLSAIALLLSVGCPSEGFAQEAEETIEEVVVFGKDFVANESWSGTKSDTPLIETAQSISIISRDLLDSWNARKMTEALRYTPGVQAEPWGVDPRFTNLTLRGFPAASESLYRDGLILRNPFFVVSYNLEPYGAERIEIPRGPVSVLYGQATPGGLLNYISKKPKPEPFGELGLVVGNHDRLEGQFDVGGSVNESRSFRYRITGLVRNSDTQNDFIPDDREYFGLSTTWDITEATTLTFLGSYQNDEALNSQSLPAAGTLSFNPNGVLPIGRFSGEPDVDLYDRSEYSIGYQFEHEFNQSFRFFQNARFNEVDLDDIVVFSFGLQPDMRTISRGAFWSFGTLEGLAIDNQLHFALNSGRVEHKLILGLDYQDVSATSDQAYNDSPPDLDIFDPVYGAPVAMPPFFRRDDIELDTVALYVQDEIKLNDKIVVNLAARYDDTGSETFSRLSNSVIQKQDDGELTYRAGFVYLMDSGFAPYVSYAESFLPSSGTDEMGNPFEPERGRQYEVGVKFQPRSFNAMFTLAYFDLERRDFVDRDIDFVFFQTGKGSSKGIEFDAYAALENGLSIMGSYSFLDTEIKEFADSALIGKEFTQVPENKASVWLDYSFQGGVFSGLGIGVGVRYQSETFSDELNTMTSPDFTMFDAAVHYQWENIRLALNVQNVADKETTASCFVRDSLLCTFAETRSIKGSINYRWGR